MKIVITNLDEASLEVAALVTDYFLWIIPIHRVAFSRFNILKNINRDTEIVFKEWHWRDDMSSVPSKTSALIETAARGVALSRRML